MQALTEVMDAGEKGRGVFAIGRIRKGRLIEVAPIVLLSRADHLKIKRTHLNNYVFDAGRGKAAVALGTASLYNHDEHPNADYELDNSQLIIRLTANRTIYPGEEITIDYGYDPKDYFGGSNMRGI